MSDVVKWGLLVAGAVALIGLVVALPFVGFIDGGEYAAALTTIVEICGDAFRFGRGAVNIFLLPFGRKVLSGLLVWLVGKWAMMIGIKIAAWVYHFILK